MSCCKTMFLWFMFIRSRYFATRWHRRGRGRPRPRAVWHKLSGFCCAYGDVKRKAGVHSALSAVATRSPVG